MTLTLAEFAAAKKLPVDFLKSMGVREEANKYGPRVVFPYRDTDGTERARHTTR
jgi:hypothetical protein